MLEQLLTPSNIAHIKNVINVKCQRQEELQPAIQVLTLTLKHLTSLRDQLAKEIESANASIAPVRKLPLETLSTIFEFCALQYDEAPLSLSRVCRKWRAAAISPQIWSRIVVDFDDTHALEKAEVYVERSRNTLLDVELHRTGYNGYGYDAWYHLIDHSRRWRSLEINARTHDLVNDVLEDLPEFAPNLVYTAILIGGLEMPGAPHPYNSTRLDFTPEFHGYPKFHSLRLKTWALPVLALDPGCILSQLTTLSLTDTYGYTFRTSDFVRPHPICGNAISVVLSVCSNLETFTFDARDSVPHHSCKCCQDPDGHSRNHYTLPALQHISIIAHHLDAFAIMGNVALPALRTAYVEPLPRYSPGLADTFSVTWCDLLRRSQAPPLEELSVFAMAPQDIVWTLEHSPRLKQLRLAYCTNPSPVIEALTSPYAFKGRGKFTKQNRWVCPKLRWFRFEECFQVPWRSVACLIQNRHRAYMNGKKLALMVDLVINGHDVFEDRDLDALANFEVGQITTLIEP